MKIVLDTNIMISAVLRQGKPLKALLHCSALQPQGWFVTQEILDEYFEVLHRPKFHFSAEVLQTWHSLIADSTVMWEHLSPFDFPRDRKDAKFLALARAIAADYLITGDGDFTDASAQLLPPTRIVSASEFCAIMSL